MLAIRRLSIVRFTTKLFNTNTLILLTASSLFAQTTPTTTKSTTPHSTTAHHSSTSSTALPKNIPPVKGLTHIAYSLKYIDYEVGKGELATPEKMYTVNYIGWLRSNGTEFDSSFPDKDHPQRKAITFPVGFHRVIPGFDTAFEGMRVGGRRRVFIPYQLAYGDQGRPPLIPPKADLVFDIELLSISDMPKPPTPTAEPARPPQPARPGTPATPGAPGNPTSPSMPATPNMPSATTAPSPSAAPAATNPTHPQ